ncbi:hypothetical protein SETIT_5G310700v2 [Setaria italica]|uniref:Uncharacterized protein n=1 Tax=Setaria italica TaxID=4555 RepID=A0A368RAQ5_SETIT|nr:hypothetical protein SETIT_5G310700v2 [Setaria italica]
MRRRASIQSDLERPSEQARAGAICGRAWGKERNENKREDPRPIPSGRCRPQAAEAAPSQEPRGPLEQVPVVAAAGLLLFLTRTPTASADLGSRPWSSASHPPAVPAPQRATPSRTSTSSPTTAAACSRSTSCPPTSARGLLPPPPAPLPSPPAKRAARPPPLLPLLRLRRIQPTCWDTRAYLQHDYPLPLPRLLLPLSQPSARSWCRGYRHGEGREGGKGKREARPPEEKKKARPAVNFF